MFSLMYCPARGPLRRRVVLIGRKWRTIPARGVRQVADKGRLHFEKGMEP